MLYQRQVLRFFTVYGPYDRPDMALQKFTRAIMNDEPISVFNYGKHEETLPTLMILWKVLSER